MIGDSLWSFYSLFCQILVLCLIVAGFLLWKKIPLFSVGILWFFICMLLVIQVIPLFTIVDEHYCYLAFIGLLLATYGLFSCCKKCVPKSLLVFAFVVVFLLLVYRTELYLPSGKDKLSQFIYRAKYSPPWTKSIYMVYAIELARSLNKLNELPGWLSEDKLKQENNKWLKKYLLVKSDYSYKFGPMQTAYKFNTYNYMFKYSYSLGLKKELNQLIKLIINSRNDSYGYYTVAWSLNSINETELAWRYFQRAIELNPRFNLLYCYGILPISLRANKFQEAEKMLLNFINLKPDSQFPYLAMGVLCSLFDHKEQALLYFKQAIDPAKKPAILTYKNYYFVAYELFLENKMLDEAKRVLKIILSMDPEDKDTRDRLLID